jgi:ATP/maltotriose-dependent transcriptional regulator MalT
LQSMNNLAKFLVAQGQLDEAELLYRRTLPLARQVFGDQHPRVATLLHNLAQLLCRRGDDEAAEPLLVEALQLRQKAPSPDAAATLAVMTELGGCQTRLGQYEKAEATLRDAWAYLEKSRARSDARSREAVIRAFAMLYDAWGKPDQAEWWRARQPPTDGPARAPGGGE